MRLKTAQICAGQSEFFHPLRVETALANPRPRYQGILETLYTRSQVQAPRGFAGNTGWQYHELELEITTKLTTKLTKLAKSMQPKGAKVCRSMQKLAHIYINLHTLITPYDSSHITQATYDPHLTSSFPEASL